MRFDSGLMHQLSADQSRVPPFGDNTADEKTWETVSGWIQACIDTHTRCNELRTHDWYPTRLLDLQHSGEHVRLVETHTHPVHGRYMTLSHRWGSSDPLCLSRATKEDMLRGLPLIALPQAFQDAIAICKRLRIRYIWIDSLCIMQDKDDLSDWLREAGLMHKVYSHSFLNVSALAAHDSSDSIFANREPSMLEDMKVMTALNGKEIGQTQGLHQIVDILFWEREMNLSHLNLRAWVLQERLLSPRVIHFASSQVFWECHELDAAESFPRGLPPVSDALRNVVRFKDLDTFKASRHPHQHASLRNAPYGVWTRIVRAYSRCGLTKKSDKLIALAGIVKQMAAKLDDEYITGMWRRSLPWEVTWHVDRPDVQTGDPSRRALEYRGPSFSWVSIDGPISPSSIDGSKPLTKLIDVDIEYATEDISGLVKSGSLVLECQLQKLSLEESPHTAVDRRIYATFVNGLQVCQDDGPEWERIGPVILLDEEREAFDPTTSAALYCVPARILEEEKPLLTVLLLELVDTQNAIYRRIGIANSMKHVEIEIMLKEVDEAASFPALSYAEGRHCIRLI